MSRSPLLLDRYFFTKISLVTNDGFNPIADTNTEAKVECGRATPVSELQSPDFVPHFRVSLIVRLGPTASGGIPPYSGEFIVLGFFRVRPDFPESEASNMVAVNGASLLYGAVREMAASLSARGPGPMLTLATLNFAEILGQQHPANQAAARLLTKKPTRHFRRHRESPSEEGVAAAQRVLAKVIAKADPKAAKSKR